MDYQEKIKRTWEASSHYSNPDMEHAIYGIVTEAGELMDQFKRAKFYGTKLDIINIKEEVGDILYYIAALLNNIESTFDECQDLNINKLLKRYPDGFSKDKAVNRNLSDEYNALLGQASIFDTLGGQREIYDTYVKGNDDEV